MPEFNLNRPHRWPKGLQDVDADLRDFACGYVEALFFTNGDCGEEDDNKLNNLGAERLTMSTRRHIIGQCSNFLTRKTRDLIAAAPGDFEQAGRDFWFTRQGHGVGFWSRDDDVWPEATRAYLGDRAEGFGECQVFCQNGRIYVD